MKKYKNILLAVVVASTLYKTSDGFYFESQKNANEHEEMVSATMLVATEYEKSHPITRMTACDYAINDVKDGHAVRLGGKR